MQFPMPPKFKMTGLYNKLYSILVSHSKSPSQMDTTPQSEDKITASAVANADCNTTNSQAKFTLFPELPLDLALQIWRAAFEKRHVDLGYMVPVKVEEPGEAEEWVASVPETLYINKQSREETLRYYDLIKLGSSGYQTLVLNPLIDTGFISLHNMAFHDGEKFNRYIKNLEKRMDLIEDASPGSLESMKQLEIRDVYWCPCFVYEGFDWNSGPFPNSDLSGIIDRFTGLKKLYITFSYKNSSEKHAGSFKQDVQQCRKFVEDYLNSHKGKYRNGKSPQVIVRLWSPIYSNGLVAKSGRINPYENALEMDDLEIGEPGLR